MKLFNTASAAAFLGAFFSLGAAQIASANVASDLSTNYSKVVENCGSVNRPGFLCSGVLLRFTNTNKKYHTWDPSPTSIETGGTSFMFLRRDIDIKLYFQGKTSGIIYYPSMLKPAGKDRAEIACAFPADGWTSKRPDGGCGATVFYPEASKPCQDQGIFTADQWYAHYTLINGNGNTDPRLQHQCGFKMSIGTQNTAAAFNEMLKAENKIFDPNNQIYNYNEIIIKTWPTDADGHALNSDKMPIQAFFYTIQGTTSGLSDAQHFQKDYYKQTGIVIPIVQVTPVYASYLNLHTITFAYTASDQVVNKGTDIVNKLTTSYNKIVESCGSADNPDYKNQPASDCSGNIIRFTSYSKKFKVWNPSQPAVGRKGVSFMYIRQDLPLDKSFKDKTSGIVYYPTLDRPAVKDVSSIRCAYPVDGYTDSRYTNGANDACGATLEYPSDSKPCQDQNITTGEAWYQHFSAIPDVGKNRLKHQCGFGLATNGTNLGSMFKVVMDGQKKLQAVRKSANYNELVLAIPSYSKVTDSDGTVLYTINDPSVLPIEAFFYTNAAGLTEARHYQEDYFEATGLYIPVVKFNLDVDTGKVTYSYNTTDQTDNYNQNNP